VVAAINPEIGFCEAGTGAFEREQHEALGAALSLAPLPSIPIFSHWDWVLGVAHSASREERIAQRDTGPAPSPAKLNANTKMNNRRMLSSLALRARKGPAKASFALD